MIHSLTTCSEPKRRSRLSMKFCETWHLLAVAGKDRAVSVVEDLSRPGRRGPKVAPREGRH